MGDLIIKPASSGSLKIQDQAGTDKITLDSSGAIASLPTGMIIQVQFTQYSDNATMTNIADDTDHVLVDGHASDGTGTEILNVDITPISTSSKIWLQCSWCGEFANYADDYNTMFFFYRDSLSWVVLMLVTDRQELCPRQQIIIKTRALHWNHVFINILIHPQLLLR